MNLYIESKRLAALFAATLDSIPASERDTITERIAIVSDHPGAISVPREKRPKGEIIHAQAQPTAAGLYSIYLNQKALAPHDDHIIKSVIAHELGHVFCDHGFNPPRWAEDDSAADIEAYGESEADEQARRWGYESVDFLFNVKPFIDAHLAIESKKAKP